MTRLWRRLREWFAKWFPRRSLGQRGESEAARYVRRLGFRIVARGYRGRFGELDLVAVDERTVVFVEVKTRASHAGGHPAEAVDATKQRRMARAAIEFLRSHNLLEYSTRFDVVAVTWREGERRPTIEHIRNAFESPGDSFFG